MMNKLLKSQDGVALLLAVFATVFISMLLAAMLDTFANDTKIVHNSFKWEKTFYAADAGIEIAIAILKDNPGWNAGFSGVAIPAGSNCKATLTVDNSKFPEVKVTSTGEFGAYRQTLNATLLVKGTSKPFLVGVTGYK